MDNKQTQRMAAACKPSILATVSLSVLMLASSPVQASVDPGLDDPFGDLNAISDNELSDLRGGFTISTPLGLVDIGIGISTAVVSSVSGLDNLGSQISDPLEGLGQQISQAVNDAVFEAGGQTAPSNNASTAAPAAQQNASPNSTVANASTALGSAIESAIGTTGTKSNDSAATTQGGGTAGSSSTSQSAVTSLTALDTPAQGAVSAAPEPPAGVGSAATAPSGNNPPGAALQTLTGPGTTRITTTGASNTATIIENTRDNVMISQIVSLNLKFQDFNRISTMNATRSLVTAVQSGIVLYSLR